MRAVSPLWPAGFWQVVWLQWGIETKSMPPSAGLFPLGSVRCS